MLSDISNRLARLIAARDFDALEQDEECRRALGRILLERHSKGQDVGHCDVVAKFARFPASHQTEVALMALKWTRADWGSPHVWAERFYD